jgi:hypothetical protein
MIIDAHVHLPYDADLLQFKLNLQRCDVTGALIIGDYYHDTLMSAECLLSLPEIQCDPNLRVAYGIDVNSALYHQFIFIKQHLDKVAAIKLYPGYQRFNINDRNWAYIYCEAENLKLPVIIHSGDCVVDKGSTNRPLLKYSHPLAIDELACRYPLVNFVIAHLGHPWIIDGTEVVYKNPNVYGDVSGLYVRCGQVEQDMVRRKLSDTFAYLEDCQRLMYGSNYPLVDPHQYVNLVASVVGSKDLDDLMYKTAQKLYGFPTPTEGLTT